MCCGCPPGARGVDRRRADRLPETPTRPPSEQAAGGEPPSAPSRRRRRTAADDRAVRVAKCRTPTPPQQPHNQLDLFHTQLQSHTELIPMTPIPNTNSPAHLGRHLPALRGGARGRGGAGVLTITKLRGAEYLIAVGRGRARGLLHGRRRGARRVAGPWAAELGLDGVVEADALRALVNGRDPGAGAESVGRASGADGAGDRRDVVGARSRCRCCGRSARPETSAAVSIAVVEATEVALGFLEERAAVARVQQGGVRRRVGTDGFAVGDVRAPHLPGRRPAAAHALPGPQRRAPRRRGARGGGREPVARVGQGRAGPCS